MEQFGHSYYGRPPATHEYPDPDYAAYATKYPWREEDDYLPSALEDLSSKSLEVHSRPGSDSGLGEAGEDEDENLEFDVQRPAREATLDLDYQVSEASVT